MSNGAAVRLLAFAPIVFAFFVWGWRVLLWLWLLPPLQAWLVVRAERIGLRVSVSHHFTQTGVFDWADPLHLEDRLTEV